MPVVQNTEPKKPIGFLKLYLKYSLGLFASAMCSRDLNRHSWSFSTSRTASSMQFETVGLKGTRRLLETHAVPLPLGTDGNSVHLAITHCITANRVAEETIAAQQSQLIHMSRLLSMGKIVAVISHEITQPLAATANFVAICTMLAEQSPSDLKQLRKKLASIIAKSARAGSIFWTKPKFTKTL